MFYFLKKILSVFYFSITKKYFQLKGRANREEYFIIYLLTILCFKSTIFLFEYNNYQINLFIILSTLFCIFLLSPSITVTIRRLHDCNLKGSWFFCFLLFSLLIFNLLNDYLFIVRIFNVLWVIFLIFKKGTSGANKYGEEPVN